MKRFIQLIVAVLLLVVIAAYFYLQDGERYKADLEAYLSDTSGYDIEINGDIQWQILPTLGLTAEKISAANAEEKISVGQLTLNAQFGNIFSALDSWQIHQFNVQNVVIESAGSQMIVRSLTLKDFQPETPSPFELDFAYQAGADVAADDFNLKGSLTYMSLEASNTGQSTLVKFTNTALTSTYANGICSGEVSDNAAPPSVASTNDDLLPVESILAFDANIACNLSELNAGEYKFNNAKLNVKQVAGKSKATLALADFFGGNLNTIADINVNPVPVEWDISFEGADIDSRKLLELSESKLNWQAPLEVKGQLKMLGNTEQALADSIVGSANLDGGQGSIDISQVKKALVVINQLASTKEPVGELPDQLQYNNLQAAWTIQGQANSLVVDLDNLQTSASGQIQFLADNLNLSGSAVVNTPQPGQQIKLTPALMNTAIPFDCEGQLAEPSCKPNTKAIGKMLVQILKNSQQDKVKKKISDAIEEKVPDQLKDAAKQLLNLFGK